MAIIKCKMCGGSLKVNENESVCKCEYCDSIQTLPKVQDEITANLFNRANNLRIKNEFDKAQEIYEKIVTNNPNEAEAYWGIVLCKYGIEYVEDPVTYSKIPTCHRTQFEAVQADMDYKAALEHADIVRREVYEKEALAIDRLQKNILEIVNKEEPFDVFICYKETDDAGRRTPDSVLANDLYHQLTQEGFKVFFSRITLEDKLGQEYEPYIFAALNSAKVMVVLGTKPEYYNAVWVKNEWSRYLGLIRNGAKKILIPAYKDMDPYDLPEEFSHLQAQDMSKLGFMQDLIRGIKKMTGDEDHDKPKVDVNVTTISGNAVEQLLKRIRIFLDDGEWEKADEYCEKVLDVDAENAIAYLYKLMIEYRLRDASEFKKLTSTIEKSNNYKNSYKFADQDLKEKLDEYVESIKNNIIEIKYQKAVDNMQKAASEKSYLQAKREFEEISDYKDSKKKIEECEALIERHKIQLLEDQYQIYIYKMKNAKTAYDLYYLAESFKQIKTYKDSAGLEEECRKRAALLKDKEKEVNKIIILAISIGVIVACLVFFGVYYYMSQREKTQLIASVEKELIENNWVRASDANEKIVFLHDGTCVYSFKSDDSIQSCNFEWHISEDGEDIMITGDKEDYNITGTYELTYGNDNEVLQKKGVVFWAR